ncbi:unnamed protein product [Adineta steineri]|uniref:Secretory protein n=1 Tax=Adineta steineri TaxID=433720 RepID=A0A818NII9_9BILA|nr:unnamed protein product [Adineta steineri]CAF3605511.1 unnamed protein product [Adineta steineri]
MSSIILITVIIAASISNLFADTVVYTSGNYKMTIINNDPGFNQNTRQRCIDTYFANMPQMCSRFNNNGCTRDVVFTIDPNYNGVAYASGGNIVISAAWLRNNPQDTDVVTHEAMHVVQRYPRGDPGWLIEGIADYARFRFGRNNPAANWWLPDFDRNHHYTNAYRVTARFLVWCENRWPNIVNQLDSVMRSNTYSANSWNQFSGGKSVDQLWGDYANNPNI